MKKINSVFTSLAISYITIVLVIVLLLCSIFYIYVPRNYNEEIRSKNQMMLRNAAQTIESAVFDRVNKIYLDITLHKMTSADPFKKGSLGGESSSIIDLQETLKQEVINNSDLIHAIHLYDPQSQALISSLYGLQVEVHAGSEARRTFDWIDSMRLADTSYLWTGPRMVPKDIYTSESSNNRKLPLITYVHSYPFNSTGEACDLMIGIDLKESALSTIIERMIPADYGSTYLIDASGVIISAADKSMLGTKSSQPAYTNAILASEAAAQSFNVSIDSTSYVVSDHKLQSNGWKIYNVVRENNFYQKSLDLQKVILLICLIAILIGIGLSGVFTVVSYHPVKRLMNKIKGLFDFPSEARHNNEYKLIDTAIHQLTNKVSSLEETLQANKPVIKHNVVLNMLRNGYSAEELEEQMLSLDLPLDYTHHCCLVIDPVSKAFKELDSKTNQYAVYKLINLLEASGFEDTHLIAEELPDRKIVVIVCANRPDDSLLAAIANLALSEVKTHFALDFKVGIGMWVQEYIEVHRSFAAAQTLIKYGFILPEASILQEFSLLNREHSSQELPPSLLAKFKEKLQARSLDGVAGATDNILGEMRQGLYSADHCQFVFMNMVSIYSDFLKKVKFKQSGQFKIDLYKQYSSVYDINGFREWLLQSVTECFSHMDKRSDERAADSIEDVKAYVCSHLAEDLSLEAVAAKVYISPKYLSKIFKEETGISYTEFVTQKRMEKAVELMNNNSLTIEQIAGSVGYATTAYFIKKFKELNGCTPKNYVRTMLKQG
ncbi:AraC family transcriptional regulator [Paenibacillus sambharensis]|uniref:AraC family transcriptional regulator n=1 Tax=Paenibacillus sambharensis TaxID=1803190 RepID=A0A2W1LQC0_9BACL|nr:AraC family transcriptional regulator [Paenibacillus sambharensis]PZD94021.1 AraC family transcriptional regulator [Paenibacillus sambharensis]